MKFYSTIKGIALAVSASLALVPSTQAADWTGGYVGVTYGAGAIVHELDIDVPALAGSSLNFNGIGGEGFFAGGQIGFDYQAGHKFVVGAFAEYDFSWIETDASLTIPGLATAEASVGIDSQWSLGLRLGYLPTASQDTLLFTSIGYTQMNLGDAEASITAGGNTLTGSLDLPTFHGYFIGSGIETMLTSHISFKAEYRFTQFDRESIFEIPGVIDVGLEPSMHTGRMAISYRFPMRHKLHEADPLK